MERNEQRQQADRRQARLPVFFDRRAVVEIETTEAGCEVVHGTDETGEFVVLSTTVEG